MFLFLFCSLNQIQICRDKRNHFQQPVSTDLLLKMMPMFVLIFWILVRESFPYDINRGACRRYALFKVTDRNTTVTEGIILRIHAKSPSFCVKNCIDISACKSINYKPSNNATFENCHILNNTRLSGSTVNVAGWNHYEPVPQTVCPFYYLTLSDV